VEDAIVMILDKKPNVLFLDVELSDGLSFEILSNLDYSNYKIVFITAHSHYAMKAIKFSAFDYLLKPVHPQELLEVVERLKKETDFNIEDRVRLLEENLISVNAPKRIVLRTAEKYIVVKRDDIVRMEADNIYTTVFFVDGNRIVVSKSIGKFDELLSDSGFVRTHRSHIVNVEQISEFVKSDGGYIRMRNGDIVPISNNKKAEVLKCFE
jgi:two-component system LytT family response regulator